MFPISTLERDTLAQLLLGDVLKVTAALAIIYVWMLPARRASSSLRYRVFMLVLVGTLAIPVLSLVIPAWSVPILPNLYEAPPKPVSDGSLNPVSPLLKPGVQNNSENTLASQPSSHYRKTKAGYYTSAAPTEPEPIPIPSSSDSSILPYSLAWFDLVLLIWIAGVMFTSGRWLRQTLFITQITQRGAPVDDPDWIRTCHEIAGALHIRRTIRVVISDRISVPLTWGLFRPIVVVPLSALDWSAEQRRIVLTHELVHIARWDYLTQWLGLINCALYWFNPLVWKITAMMAVEREQSCDDYVLSMGTRSSDYALSLLALSRSMRMLSDALAMGGKTNLGKRLYRILDNRLPRHPISRVHSISLVLLLAILVLPLSTLQLSRTSAQGDEITLSIAVHPEMRNQGIEEAIFQDFEDAHPGVRVALVDAINTPDPENGLDAYFTAMDKYASSADVVFTANNVYLTAAVVPPGTRAGYFLDLAPMVATDTTLNIDDFYSSVWKSFQWDNGIWALPVSTEATVFSYDKRAFDSAGLTYPNDNWTLDDLVNAATKLTVKDADGNITLSGFAAFTDDKLTLWHSLLGVKLYDDTILPNPPKFAQPALETLVTVFRQLEADGFAATDNMTEMAPLNLTFPWRIFRGGEDYGAALLPGGKAGLLTVGFAVSAGTEHPELAYALTQYLTTRPELAYIIGMPARKSILSETRPEWMANRANAEQLAFIENAIENGIPFSDVRYANYLKTMPDQLSVKDGLLAVQSQAINDLKAADAKKGTFRLVINEPAAPTLPPGKVAIKFNVTSPENPLPTEDQWDRVVQDFVASDPQVGRVDLRASYNLIDEAASRSDCFYLPFNAVPTMIGAPVIALDPLLSADSAFDRSDIPAALMTAVQRGSKTYALPIGIEPMILRYNNDRFTAANVAAPTNNWTIDAFVDALQRLKPEAGSSSPLIDNGTGGSYLLILMAAYGGMPIDYRVTPVAVNFTDPATVNAIRQVLDLAKEGYISYSAVANFQSGAPIYPDENSMIYPVTLNAGAGLPVPVGSDVQTGKGGQYKVVLFPSGQQYSGLAYKLGTLYISAATAYPEACYRFISKLAQHPELFSIMPVRHSMLTNPALQTSTNSDALALYQQMDALLQNPNTIPFPVVDKGSFIVTDFLVQNWLYEAFDSYVLNDGDLEAALQDGETYAKNFLTCIAKVPAVDGSNEDESEAAEQAYMDCAQTADPRLKTFIEQLTR